LVFKVPWGECRERPYVVGNVYGSPSGRCSLRPPGSALNSALRASNYGSPSGRRRWNSLRELDTFSRAVGLWDCVFHLFTSIHRATSSLNPLGYSHNFGCTLIWLAMFTAPLSLTRPRIEIGIDPIRSYLFY
jgi:hypothetical protein